MHSLWYLNSKKAKTSAHLLKPNYMPSLVLNAGGSEGEKLKKEYTFVITAIINIFLHGWICPINRKRGLHCLNNHSLFVHHLRLRMAQEQSCFEEHLTGFCTRSSLLKCIMSFVCVRKFDFCHIRLDTVFCSLLFPFETFSLCV